MAAMSNFINHCIVDRLSGSPDVTTQAIAVLTAIGKPSGNAASHANDHLNLLATFKRFVGLGLTADASGVVQRRVLWEVLCQSSGCHRAAYTNGAWFLSPDEHGWEEEEGGRTLADLTQRLDTNSQGWGGRSRWPHGQEWVPPSSRMATVWAGL